MSDAHFITLVLMDPDPPRRIAGLSDGHLDALIAELAETTNPNVYQAEVYARAMHEVLRRWRAAGHGSQVKSCEEGK